MKKFLIVLASVFLFSIPAYAINIETGENLIINDDILDDSYFASGNAQVHGNILGDLYIFGGNIFIKGNIFEDLVVIGGKVNVEGNVSGDLRVIGGQVSVYGNIGDDIVVAGGQIDIAKDSVVDGSILAGAGLLTVDGQVKGELRGAIGMLFLNGKIFDDVTVTIEDSIIVSETAEIYGDLNYSGLIEANIPENVVKGEINFNEFQRESIMDDLNKLFFLQKLLSFIAAMILMILFVILSPRALVKSGELTKENVVKSFGVGLLTLIAGLMGSIVLMVTVVGIPIAIILFSILLIFYYLAKVFVAAWLASYIFDFKRKKIWVRFRYAISLTIALLLYYLLSLIPIVGWIVNIILFIIGIGSLVLVKVEYFKYLKSKKML